MILNEVDITEYQDLIRKRFGREISRDEALEDALSLIQFVSLTQKAIAKNKITEMEVENEKSMI